MSERVPGSDERGTVTSPTGSSGTCPMTRHRDTKNAHCHLHPYLSWLNAPLALQYPPTFDSSTPCVPQSRALIGFCALPCAPSPSYAKVPSPRGVGFSASRLLVARQTCTGSRRPRLGVQCNHCCKYLPATATGVLLLRTHRPRGPGGESWAEIVSSVQAVSLPDCA
jgi:hypothetical protein